MTRTTFAHPAISAALAAAADLLSMEAVFIGGLDERHFVLQRVGGAAAACWPGLDEGAVRPRQDSFCQRMLSGAPTATADAAREPAYRDLAVRTDLAIASYVGVPITSSTGEVLGTLCGIDRGSVTVPDEAIAVLRRLADVIAAHLEAARVDGVIIRRTPHGWAVDGDDLSDGSGVSGDLVSSMVLADLLTEDLQPGSRPPRADGADEMSRLRSSVTQLEHALGARVVVEQAIGVLAERRKTTPRQAFEALRKVARSHGWRVHDLAQTVVSSVTDPGVRLPPGLT